MVHAVHQRPIILTFVRHYLPNYKSGGPVRSIANLVDALGDEFEFRIVTSGRDAMGDLPYGEVAVNQWNKVGNAFVYYASPNNIGFKNCHKLISEPPHDVLYLNSLLDPTFTTLPLLAQCMNQKQAISRVIAPRGEQGLVHWLLSAGKKCPFYFSLKHSDSVDGLVSSN